MSRRQHISEELREISESLAGLDVTNPYTVPAGYFESFADTVLRRIRAEQAGSPQEELEMLSPFLSKIDKTTPYTVPQGYFDNLKPAIPATGTPKVPARVVRITPRRVFRYAAAAVTVGIITVISWLFIKTPEVEKDQVAVNNDTLTEQQIQSDFRNFSDLEIADFVDQYPMSDPENPTLAAQLDVEPFRLMLSEVSDEELEKYLELQPVKEKFN